MYERDNMRTKKNIFKLTSVLLALCIVLVQPGIVQASKNVSSMESYVEEINSFNEDINNGNIQQVYDDLSNNAKTLFLNYLVTNTELYDFHLQNVVESENSLFLINQSLYNSSETTIANTLASGQLDILNYQLNQIQGLSQSVIYALMAAGASILADIASMGTAKLVTILVAGGCLIVLVANWGEVQSAWPQIVNAFKAAFGNKISTSTINSGFSQAQARYQQDYSKNMEANGVAFVCSYTNSCWKHIDYASAMSIMGKRDRNYRIYSSHHGNSAMVVIDIPQGTTANISNSLATTLLGNQNVGRGKLYILYNLDTHTYFHMHVKIIGDDTHFLRDANGLCYQTWPYYSYDAQYDHPSHSLYIPTDAWNIRLK